MKNYNSITKIMKIPITLIMISPLQRHCYEEVLTDSVAVAAVDSDVSKLIEVARDKERRNYKLKK